MTMTQNAASRRLGVSRFADVKLQPTGEAMLSLFACTGVSVRSAVYVSTPLTSGEIVIDWHERTAAGEESPRPLKAEVFRENTLRAKRLIARVRAHFDTPTIEPTSLLDVPGWDQNDYHLFWCATIERYAYGVVFNQGWNYSTGCVAEFASAVLSGADLYDDELNLMSPSRALRLIQNAQRRIKDASLPTDVFDEVMTTVQGLVG